MSGPRKILVGDVHGCISELEALAKACGVRDQDELWLVGDLVAKGPESKAVVAWARNRGARAVLGNHDAHALGCLGLSAQAVERKRRRHHRDVIESLTEPERKWLAALPRYARLPGDAGHRAGYIVVHGGLVPGVGLEAQDKDLILNLRSLRADGHPSKKIEGRPWASVWSGPEHVVFGHDAVRGLQQYPFATGLDTGCVYGGRLTALILPERQLVSVPAARAYVDVQGLAAK